MVVINNENQERKRGAEEELARILSSKRCIATHLLKQQTKNSRQQMDTLNYKPQRMKATQTKKRVILSLSCTR